VPVYRLGLGRPVTEHLDTGQTTPQASRWATGGYGAELELRVLHAPVAWRATSSFFVFFQKTLEYPVYSV